MTMHLDTGRSSIFERVGGFANVSRIVMDFYDRVLESDLLGPWFADTDMARLVDHQTKFVAALMGGPASYADDTLARVHHRLAISRAAFDEMKVLLHEAMEEHGVPHADMDTVLREVERCAPMIVNA